MRERGGGGKFGSRHGGLVCITLVVIARSDSDEAISKRDCHALWARKDIFCHSKCKLFHALDIKTYPNVTAVVRGDGEEATEEICQGMPLEKLCKRFPRLAIG